MALQKENFYPGSTSTLMRVFIGDSSVTTGAGKTGITAGSASLTCYYLRDGNPATTQITLTAATLGTWVSGGFVEVDATHMPGVYELGVPNAVLTASAKKATIFLQGATNMQNTFVDIDMLLTGDPYAALATTTYAPAAAALSTSSNTIPQMLSWLATISGNKIATTVSTQTLYAGDNTTTVAAATVTDDGTTSTRGRYV